MTSSEVARRGQVLENKPWRSMADVVAEMKMLVHLANAYPDIGGLPTGITELDHLVSHVLTPGHLVVVAAETGGGKTALVQQLSERFAQRVPVLSLVLEDTETGAAMRMAAGVSRTDLGQLRRGYAGAGGVPQDFYYAADHMSKLKLDMVSEMALPVEQVVVMAMDWMITQNVDRGGVLIIDQLSHLVTSDPDWWLGNKNAFIPRPPRAGAAETTWLKWQTRVLKVAAQHLGLLVILVHQLNENHGTGKPGLSSMSGSRGINQEADLILLPWRPRLAPEGFEDPLGGPAAAQPTRTADGEAFIICPKSRHGVEFEIPVHWIGAEQRFADPGVNAAHSAIAPQSARSIEGESAMDALRRQIASARGLRQEAAAQEKRVGDKLMAEQVRRGIGGPIKAHVYTDENVFDDDPQDNEVVWDGVVEQAAAAQDVVDAEVVVVAEIVEDAMVAIPLPRVLSRDEYDLSEIARKARHAAYAPKPAPTVAAAPARPRAPRGFDAF